MKNTLPKLLVAALLSCLLLNTSIAGEKSDKAKEAERKSKVFLKWDEDGDKQLNEDEFTKMNLTWMEKNGQDGGEAEAKKRFKRKDADGDGFVTFEEQTGLSLPE
jgi:Ca2+-binding EF-hand superfamily protein